MYKNFFLGIVVILAAYIFYLTFAPVFNYYIFKNELKETMKIIRRIDRHKDVMKRIIRHTKEYNIPITAEDVELELVHDQFQAKIHWEETVEYFPFYPLYQKTFEFYIDTSE